MNLHRALDKLADGAELRNEAEERDLGKLIEAFMDHRLTEK